MPTTNDVLDQHLKNFGEKDLDACSPTTHRMLCSLHRAVR